jgi:hypothetical protein
MGDWVIFVALIVLLVVPAAALALWGLNSD